jgi:hypothetical protein
VQRCRYTYRRPCRTDYNPDYYSRDQIKCRMAETTMPNTLPNTMPNTMPNLLRSYITENTILNEIPTQTRRSRATQLRSIDDCKSTSESSPSNRYSLRSRMRLVAGGATTFKKRGMTVPESQTTPTANNYRTGSARTKHREIHSPIEKASSDKCTWRRID